jgi:excisionase family DNA binding protein
MQMSSRIAAQHGEAQLSLFEVDALRTASAADARPHRPLPTRSHSPALSPRRSETPTPAPESSIADSLLSPEQVACRCGLSRKAVYRAVARGELRAARILSRLRIDPRDVEAWIRTNLVDVDRPVPAPARARLPTTGLRSLLPEP